MIYKEYKFEIEVVTKKLNPNSRKIFDEIVLAKKNKMWATVIVFSLTILDNIFHQEDMSNMIDGIELNSLKYSKEINWLRKKRNLILHYENGFEDKNLIFLNNHDLKKDSLKAYNILCKSLVKIFKN